MKNGQAKWRAWAAAAGMSALAGGAWGVELPWEWEGKMKFGEGRTEWVVDLEGAPERVEVRLEGGGGVFAVDEASWDGAWNGTPLGSWESGTGGWTGTRLAPDGVTRHLRFRTEGGTWLLKGVRVEGGDGTTRLVFDREDGFTVEEGEEGVWIHAQVVNGGGGWFGEDAWECDEGAGKGEGPTFCVDTGMPGVHWARVRAGCDGSDEEVEGVIRWRVGEMGAASELPMPPTPKTITEAEGEPDGMPFPRARTSQAAVERYYAGCYGPDGQLLAGEDLKAALCRTINTGTTTNDYGSNLNSILKKTDACPTDSRLVQCIYLQCGISSFNKEHLWPQSHGIDGKYPAYSDLHHLRASDSAMNSARGNLDFDNCRDDPDAKEKNGCWYTQSAWEPPDSAKGDVARASLYMAVRYEVGANPNGDLELVEATGTGPGTNVLGRLSTLLDWNELDPVDDFEIYRNDLIYERYQGNRNPFIDHPEWARRVFAPGSWSGKGGVRAVVTALDARQRYPWNGLVDIDYEVAVQGGSGNEDVWVDVWGVDQTTGEKVEMCSLSGTGARGPVKAGRYRMTWNSGTDAPELVSDNFAVQMVAGGRPVPYLAIDLSGGEHESCGGVETWEGEPCGGWPEEYKTSKLVMRQIEAGTFSMGSREEELGREDDEVLHEVSLFPSYWMGVFEVTQKQWELVMGNNPSAYLGDMRPVEGVDYAAIRGAGTTVNDIGDGSFLEVLRAKTGLEFDLPTEAQWEYACRAETRTALNSGKDLSGKEECRNLAELGRYAGNRTDGKGSCAEHTVVGSYRPNVWGLYDMHGNVSEWCLDWYGAYGMDALENPSGATSGVLRVRRGGDWEHAAKDARSACRGRALPATADANGGFRLACNLADSRSQRLAFAEIGEHSVDEHVALEAVPTSGGEVAFSVVSGPGVVEGRELSFTGTGTVVVRATQAGSDGWWAVHAEQVVQVGRTLQKLSFATIGAQTVTNRVVLSATATGGGDVAYSVVSGPGVIEGDILSFAEPGEVVVEASQAGNELWTPVAVTQTVRVFEEGVLFAVSVDSDISHGRVIPDVFAAPEGEIVTLSVEPEDGWKLAGLAINGESIKGRSFVMPPKDVLVSAVFVERVNATYVLVETAEEFEPGGEYILVARTPGLFTSAMRNGIKAARIGVEEVEITEEDTIVTDSDSIVWQISPGTEDGTWTIYNAAANVFAASPYSSENHSQLLPDGTNMLSLWTLDLDSLPQVIFRSVRYTDRWLSRNLELGNEYFAAYRSYGRLPCLYKKGGDVFKVSFDQTNGFPVWKGNPTSIVATAKFGMSPYTYVWTGDCSGEGETLEIPETLDVGKYSVTVTATDSDGQEVSRAISFRVRVPELVTLTIEGPSSMQAGEKAEYACIATYSDGTKETVWPEWALVTGGKFAVLDSEGILTAHDARLNHSVTLQALFDELTVTKKVEIISDNAAQIVTVAKWLLNGTGEGYTDYPSALVVGDFTAAPGVVLPQYTSSGITSYKWNYTEPNENAYYEFSLTPTGVWPLNAGILSLSLGGSKNGPSHCDLRYEEDGEWRLVESVDFSRTSTIYYPFEFDVSDIIVAPGQTLRFRLYGWDALNASGTFGVRTPTLTGELVGMPTNHFEIVLSPETTFEVEQGYSAAIVATAVNPAGAVTYEWDAGGVPGSAQTNVFTIDSSDVGGPYKVTCNANDGTFDAKPQSVSFSIVPPPTSFSVAVADGIAGGSISLSHTEAVEGTMVSITALPNTGLQLAGIVVNGTLMPGTTFTMPSTPVTVSAVFSNAPTYIERWIGETPGFRVDARAEGGVELEAREDEWVVWDAAWTEGTARVEVTLDRPGGTVETLGGGEGSQTRGSAEWMPGEGEWGTFTLRHTAWDAKGRLLEELLARRVWRMPAERAYAEWVAARVGTMESLPMDEDTDGDGASNWEEYVADTNPMNEEEVFESRVEVAEDGKVRVVPSVVSTGRVYGVKMWQDLTEEPEFRDLGYGHEGIGVDMNGDGETMGFGTMSVSVP